MVSYYGQTAMYRHQQQISAPNGAFHQSGGPSMSSWYPAGFHAQGGAQLGTTPAGYCMPEEQPMWHHHTSTPGHHNHHHNLFQHDFQDFIHAGIPALQHAQNNGGGIVDAENHLPSPPITVSGSDMSSPGAQSGNLSPHHQNSVQTRPPPARSPYEWIKKASYQSQPNPGKTRTKDKYRVVYTDHQRIELEKEFTFNNKYITIRRKSELASNLGLSERQIKIWFQNRRAKERKQNKKRAEEKNQVGVVDMGANTNNYTQNHLMNATTQHQMLQQNMDLHNQAPPQSVLPNIMAQPAGAASIMHQQRFMDVAGTTNNNNNNINGHAMKLETGESDPLG